jgi:hypothetical protein
MKEAKNAIDKDSDFMVFSEFSELGELGELREWRISAATAAGG